MHKEIEKAVLRITQAMEKNRQLYAEADGNYRDTGYDRYWNKMEKLDAEYVELEKFLNPDREKDATPETIRKLNEAERILKNIKSKWDYLKSDLPVSAEYVGINDLLKDVR